jgi:hypothetical protein
MRVRQRRRLIAAASDLRMANPADKLGKEGCYGQKK